MEFLLFIIHSSSYEILSRVGLVQACPNNNFIHYHDNYDKLHDCGIRSSVIPNSYLKARTIKFKKGIGIDYMYYLYKK